MQLIIETNLNWKILVNIDYHLFMMFYFFNAFKSSSDHNSLRILITIWTRYLYPYARWSSVIMSVSMFALICMKNIWIHTCRKCSIRRKFLFWEFEDYIFNSGVTWPGGNQHQVSLISPYWLPAKTQKPLLYRYQSWRHIDLHLTRMLLPTGGELKLEPRLIVNRDIASCLRTASVWNYLVRTIFP